MRKEHLPMTLINKFSCIAAIIVLKALALLYRNDAMGQTFGPAQIEIF